MNIKSRLARMERVNRIGTRRPAPGSATTDRLLCDLAGIRLRMSPQDRKVAPSNVSPLEYAEIQQTIALAQRRWLDAERWSDEIGRHTAPEVLAMSVMERLMSMRQQRIAKMKASDPD